MSWEALLAEGVSYDTHESLPTLKQSYGYY